MGQGGTSGGGRVIQESQAQVPAYLEPLLQQSANQLTTQQMRHPLGALWRPMVQQIPELTPLQQLLIGMQAGFAMPGADLSQFGIPEGGGPDLSGMSAATAPELAALAQLGETTGGPVGSSPVTEQARQVLEQQYNQYTLPSIQSELGLAGLGTSSAMGDAIARARTGVAAATTPLLQQEVANRMMAAQLLQALGPTLAGRQRGDVATALGGAGLEYDVEAQQAQAAFNDLMRRAALTEQITFGPLDIFGPSLIGQAGTSTTRQATRGGGLIGSLFGGGSK